MKMRHRQSSCSWFGHRVILFKVMLRVAQRSVIFQASGSMRHSRESTRALVQDSDGARDIPYSRDPGGQAALSRPS